MNILYLIQEVLNKVNARLEFVLDQRKHGLRLVETDQIQKQTDKEEVLADTVEITNKEKLLQTHLKTARNM